jgi:hypothetical protein
MKMFDCNPKGRKREVDHIRDGRISSPGLEIGTGQKA